MIDGTTTRDHQTLSDHELRFEGRGDPLVYVPGIDGTGALFYTQVPRLAHRFRVATYRLRDSASSMDDLVDDLAHIVEQAAPGDQPVTLVAESFGGALAMSFALRHRALVQSMIVLNSFARFRDPWQLQVAMGGMRVLPRSVTRQLQRLSAGRQHSPTTLSDDIRRSEQLRRTATHLGYLNRLRILSRYDVREQLPHLSVPTLYLAADQDSLIPSVQQANFMAARVPGADVRILSGHGHASFLAPDVDVNRLMHEWHTSRSVVPETAPA